MPSRNEQAATAHDLTDELSEEAVREYLKDNADFLQRHPDMLDYLHIEHASGSAVSLVEKQVSVLRERNIDMRHRLQSLTANARDNDKLFEQTRELVLELLDATSVDQLYTRFNTAMTETFGVDYATMILYCQTPGSTQCRVETKEESQAQIGALFRGNKAVCGTLRKEELQFLFPSCGETGSAALVPLAGDEQLGLIAIGSADASRYHSSVGTLFLNHIADVMARLLPRLQAGTSAT
ncbi:MAG: DUF484 family protein [Halioglobus sp.]